MASKMATILKLNSTYTSQSKLITETILVVFGEFDWYVVVFQRNKIFNEQDGSNNRVWNHMGFVMMHFTENITDSKFFVMAMFGFFLCSGNRIHQYIYHFFLDLIISLNHITLIKVPTLGKYSIKSDICQGILIGRYH